MNKTAPFPTAPREGATTNVRAAGPSLPGRILLALANSRELMLLALIAILVVGMTVVYPNNFPTSFNISAVLLNAAQNGILVAGMMLLMIAGSFDLSVGSTLALAGVWAGVVVGWWGWPAPLGFVAALLVGGIAGAVNGAIVTRLGIQRADRHARHHDHLPRPHLSHRGHRRDADQRQLRGLWRDGRVRNSDPLLGDAGDRGDRRLGDRAHTLLPPVLFHWRQRAGREALGHQGRAA